MSRVTAESSRGAYERGIGVFNPGAAGPAEYIEEAYDERFEVVHGEFVFYLNGKARAVQAGDRVTVRKGTARRFRCAGEGLGVLVVETHPAVSKVQALGKLAGLAQQVVRAWGAPFTGNVKGANASVG